MFAPSWHSWCGGSKSSALKTLFVVNPRSGASRRALPFVQAFARQHGAEVATTERSRHASELAAAALTRGIERVVAVGGDGTMNEVAGVLAGTGATLGLVPCGSGDGLGRHLGIHGPPAHALALLAAGHTRLIDTGLADGHPFFCAAGLGFEAEIAHRFNQLERRGFLRYLTTSARYFATYQPEDYTLIHGDETGRVRAFTLAVSNSDQYGNGAHIAPSARVDDGLLDLTAVPPIRPLNVLPLLARLFSGSLHRARGVVLRRSARFVIERAEPGLLHTDGEIHEAGRTIEFTVRPASLRIVCPR